MLLTLTAKHTLLNQKQSLELGSGVITGFTLASAMPVNPFPNPPVKLTELQSVNDALQAASSAALSGSFSDVAALKTAEKTWDYKFTLTANYVTFQAAAATDVSAEQVIRWGGFEPTKDVTTLHPLPPASLTLQVYNNHKKNAIVAESLKKIDFGKGNVFTFVPDGATVEFEGNTLKITVAGQTIYVVASTKKKVELFNLPQTPLNVYLYSFNAAGSGPATKPVSITPGMLNNDQKSS